MSSVSQLTISLSVSHNIPSYRDHVEEDKILVSNSVKREDAIGYGRVKDGYPIAQQYGIGGAWVCLRERQKMMMVDSEMR